MVNFMVDLETLSTDSNAIILTIGCIPFGSDGSCIVDEEYYFYNRVDLSSYNDRPEFHIDYNTLLWWLEQDPKPRSEAFLAEPRKSIEQVMIDFVIWIKQICNHLNDTRVNMWSHGKDFDCVILQNAFKFFDIPCPWKFWDTRDTRTIYSLADVDMRNIIVPDEYKAHNAIGDCLKQIEGIKQAFNIINNIRSNNGTSGSPKKRHRKN